VKIPAAQSSAPKVKWRRPRLPLPDRFGSHARRLRYADLVHPKGETGRKIAAPEINREDGSHSAPSHQRKRTHSKCGWKHGEGQRAVGFDHAGAATSALTKCAFSWKSVCRKPDARGARIVSAPRKLPLKGRSGLQASCSAVGWICSPPAVARCAHPTAAGERSSYSI
jgi:hypothetical protein